MKTVVGKLLVSWMIYATGFNTFLKNKGQERHANSPWWGRVLSPTTIHTKSLALNCSLGHFLPAEVESTEPLLFLIFAALSKS